MAKQNELAAAEKQTVIVSCRAWNTFSEQWTWKL